MIRAKWAQARCLHRSAYRFSNASVALASSPRPGQKVYHPKTFCPTFARRLTIPRSVIPLLLQLPRDMNLLQTPWSGRRSHGCRANRHIGASTGNPVHDSPRRHQLRLSLRSNPTMSLLPLKTPPRRERTS